LSVQVAVFGRRLDTKGFENVSIVADIKDEVRLFSHCAPQQRDPSDARAIAACVWPATMLYRSAARLP
jgi:hypothetical protein